MTRGDPVVEHFDILALEPPRLGADLAWKTP